MFDFGSLGSAKKKAEINGDKKLEQFYLIYDSALEKFRKLVTSQNFDHNILKEITGQLLEALHLVKNQAEPYLFLAYICYISGDISSTIKYLKVSSFLNPDLQGIESLRQAIASESSTVKVNHLVTSQNHSSIDITDNNKRAPPKISPIRRIQRI
jgi:hypothetical protein